ncbi:MAG: SRPBCC family protein [Actinomycetota bacterium]
MSYESILMMRVTEVLRKGWPVVVELAETMPGPPDTVWRLITDWENQSDWMLEATDFVVTSPHREGPGVTAEATIRIGGITTRDSVEVVAWEPEKLLGIEHGGWVSGRGEIHLTPLGSDRTHVFWIETLYPPLGVAGALGLAAFKPLMARIFKRDLRVLQGLVRAASKTPRPR